MYNPPGMPKKIIWPLASSLLVVGLVIGLAFADDFTTAELHVQNFQSEYNDLRKLTPAESRRLVTAICEADEDERQSVAKEAAARVAKLVQTKYDALESIKNDTISRLDAVSRDRSETAHHADARAYKRKVIDWWKVIDRMTNSLRGKNHPAIRYIIGQGQKAHRDRQRSRACDVSEYTVGANRLDCIRASDCTVVELKPDNKRGMRRGKEQVQRYAALLNSNADERKKLATKHSDFKTCKTYRWEVWCYKLCPDIDPDTGDMTGDMTKAAAEWRKCGSK